MIEVAAGILRNRLGQVLLMQRLPGKHLAGLWEFPGGKLEPGESVGQALVRELREELGIEVAAFEPLISIPWHYPEKVVRLHALRVTDWRGEPKAIEGHPLRWMALDEIDAGAMPAADVPIVTALRLPASYAISACLPLPQAVSSLGGEGDVHAREARSGFYPLPQTRLGERETSAQRLAGEGAVAANALLQLRMPDAERAVIRRTARSWMATDQSLRERLLINRDIELARELGVGVHLKASQLRELRERPLPANMWVGASCHDAKELELAARLGADFATLSPVCATASHPESTPLGWERFARLVADARLPVYALGGVVPNDLERARAAGARGVAGIRAFTCTG